MIETLSRYERGGPGCGPDGHLRGSKGLLYPRGETRYTVFVLPEGPSVHNLVVIVMLIAFSMTVLV